MSPLLATVTRRAFSVGLLAALAMLGCGGGDDPATLSANFTASPTATTPHLIKLVQKSKSGSRVVVQAVVYGPDVALDMYSFAFDVKIGDTSVVRYVDGLDVAGNALVPFAGQTIQKIVATAVGDTSRVVVGVSKQGGGAGNGVAGTSAVIVELTFQVLKSGTTTLALTGAPGGSPVVLDSTGAVIAVMSFDAATATMQGISSGGSGGY